MGAWVNLCNAKNRYYDFSFLAFATLQIETNRSFQQKSKANKLHFSTKAVPQPLGSTKSRGVFGAL